jgi:hypothetical protein
LRRQRAVLLNSHENISADTDGFAQGALRAPEHLGRLCVPVLFGKFSKWDTAHCGVLDKYSSGV